ncbi:hypothetical protein GCM10023080_034870 [Streptomyces pseudoechinosporeus]
MGKHRKKEHYRRIVIAAVAMGTVGVPSVALACTDWRDSAGHQLHSAEKNTAQNRWNDADRDRAGHGDRGRGRNGAEHSEPRSAASKTPTASARTPKTTAPKPRTTAPSRTPKTTAPKPRTTTPSSTPKTTAPPTSPSTPKATPPASGATARIVQLVNAERSKAGCSPVTLNAVLTKAAQAHSKDMAAHRNMSHTGSDGSSPGDRITRAGYSWSTYGENVAYGYATPEQVMAGWMSSPGHKANILNCAFKEIGVGLAQPDSYWTQDFGTAR